MKTALRLTIQIFWVLVGAMSLWLLIDCVLGLFSGHIPTTPLAWMLTLLFIPLLITLAYVGWSALFRVSAGLIAPSVGIVALIMMSFALHVFNHVIAITERESHLHEFFLMPLVGLLWLFVIVAGAFKYYRFAVPAITAMLDAERRRSSARVL